MSYLKSILFITLTLLCFQITCHASTIEKDLIYELNEKYELTNSRFELFCILSTSPSEDQYHNFCKLFLHPDSIEVPDYIRTGFNLSLRSYYDSLSSNILYSKLEQIGVAVNNGKYESTKAEIIQFFTLKRFQGDSIKLRFDYIIYNPLHEEYKNDYKVKIDSIYKPKISFNRLLIKSISVIQQSQIDKLESKYVYITYNTNQDKLDFNFRIKDQQINSNPEPFLPILNTKVLKAHLDTIPKQIQQYEIPMLIFMTQNRLLNLNVTDSVDKMLIAMADSISDTLAVFYTPIFYDSIVNIIETHGTKNELKKIEDVSYFFIDMQDNYKEYLLKTIVFYHNVQKLNVSTLSYRDIYAIKSNKDFNKELIDQINDSHPYLEKGISNYNLESMSDGFTNFHFIYDDILDMHYDYDIAFFNTVNNVVEPSNKHIYITNYIFSFLSCHDIYNPNSRCVLDKKPYDILKNNIENAKLDIIKYKLSEFIVNSLPETIIDKWSTDVLSLRKNIATYKFQSYPIIEFYKKLILENHTLKQDRYVELFMFSNSLNKLKLPTDFKEANASTMDDQVTMLLSNIIKFL